MIRPPTIYKNICKAVVREFDPFRTLENKVTAKWEIHERFLEIFEIFEI